jgi:3D (Asp-Asp-Asp) domain-containing protein
MSGKKVIIPLFILSLLFTSLFISRNDIATATPDQSINQRTTAVVQLQQALNNKGYWCGPIDGILGSQAYQAVIRFQFDSNLIADGLVGLRARQAPSLALIDSASAQTPVLAENPAMPANSATANPSNSVNSAPVKPVEKSAVKVAEKPAAVSRGTSTSSRQGRVIAMVATGYDGCYECNKPYYGAPSYIGLPLARGIVAVDPKVIPMGTRLYVEGYGNAIAADQGNAIKGNRIDLFFDTHQQALKWGMKTVKVTILGK